MFLITEQYLTDRVNVSKQKNAEDLKRAFQNVSDFYIKDLLSIPLYDLLLSSIDDSVVELTAHQAALLDKVQIYFAFMVQYDLLLDLFEITNKGTQVDSNSADIDLIKIKRTEVMAKADKIKSDILKYLEENRSEFPQYYANSKPVAQPSNGSPIVYLDTAKIWLGRAR